QVGRRVWWWTVAGVWGGIACGLIFFAWRTWHYTGVFSVFHGTSGYLLAIFKPDSPMRANFDRLFTNLASVLTVNDPPRFDVYALPVMTGALVAVLSLAGAPTLRDLPAAAVLFFASAIAAQFVVAGSAYPARFSIHLLPTTSALTVCAIAGIAGSRKGLRHRKAIDAGPDVARRL